MTNDYEIEDQYIVECNIDDMNPEGYEYIINSILEIGALDVYLTPIIMKKGRPAVKLTALTTKELVPAVKDKIFMETSSFGLRSWQVEKTMLKRSFEKVNTQYGELTIKYGWLNGKIIKAKPEYEDCRFLAEKTGIPLHKIMQSAIKEIK